MKAYQAPQDYQAAVKLIQALQDIAKNPKIITEATEEALKASQLSADQVKQLQEAQATVELNQRLGAQLLKDKQDHRDYVERSHKELDQKYADVQQSTSDLGGARQRFQTEVSTASEQLNTRHATLTEMEQNLDTRTADIIQREQTCHDILADIEKREKQLEAREAKLSDDKVKLAAKKKKLAEAAKED